MFQGENYKDEQVQEGKKNEKKKEVERKRDKSDRKKAKIGSILYAGEGFSFRPFLIF